MTTVYPDAEGALRTWLRSRTAVTAAVAQRVFFGVPDDATYPLITIQRVGGGDDTSDAPLDEALIQIDCWGRLYDDSRHGDKAQALAVKNVVRGELAELVNDTRLDPSTIATGGTVVADLFAPDPDDNRPRYTLTVALTARAA